jgi:hypothetical protein
MSAKSKASHARRQRNYYWRNPEKVRQRWRTYYWRDPESERQRCRDYRAYKQQRGEP